MAPASVISLAALYILVLSVGSGFSKLIVQMTRVEVVNNRNEVNATAVIRRLDSAGKYVADFQLVVYHGFTHLQVRTVYYVPTISGNLDKPIYNHTVDFCTYLKRPNIDRVLKIVYEVLNDRGGNLPRKCPVTAGMYAFNTSFDNFRIPTFLPESNFRFDLNFYHGLPKPELGFESHWFGRLRKVKP